jgi:plastocyanin
MRRSLLVVLVSGVLVATVAGVTVAASSGSSSSSTAAASTSAGSSMPMPTGNTASTALGPATVALHQRVVQVKISNFAFKPARIIVSPGTKVVWTNEDSDPHTVTTDKPGFSSQALDTNQKYTLVTKRAGTFTYHCTIHPFMHGALVVQS